MRRLTFVLCFLFAGSLHASPILVIDNGILMGAQGVNVDGGVYDVLFRNGTCAQTCAETTIVMQGALAAKASLALLTSVFQDTNLGLFGTHPELTFGCISPSCNTWTLEGFRFGRYSVWSASNLPDKTDETENNTGMVIGQILGFDPSQNTEQYTWAIWSHHVNPVVATPEPSSLALVAIGLLILSWTAQGKRARSAIRRRG